MREEKTIFKIPSQKHNEKDLLDILKNHSEIKFASFMSVDLYGNVTDERIPIREFVKDLNGYLSGKAIQTDGSSVNLPLISKLNDARVDMYMDLNSTWYVDYNEELIDNRVDKPIGTLVIPAFLKHNGKVVDSRSILQNSIDYCKKVLLKNIRENSIRLFNINPERVKNLYFTTATELEFWTKTPTSEPKIEELSASQNMNEQYWNKIEGTVRSALEECLLQMEDYELYPEMGHKEVGGVRPVMDINGKYSDIMEQIEIDWKYSQPLDTADKQIIVKNLVKKIFEQCGLETTFMAKPINHVAGNGMHLHLGAVLVLDNDEKINIFHSRENSFLSVIGYGALMGLLKNYEVVSPFVSSTDDALNRLKPGYEAPVATVASLGYSVENATRNRSVLVGVINNLENAYETRFELRSPNPNSNLFLSIASSLMAMIDGVEYAVNSKKNEAELLKELSKEYGENAKYLEKNRMYRSEEDIFEFYTEDEREKYFGKEPHNVYENIIQLDKEKEKINVLKKGDVFREDIIASYKQSVINNWKTLVQNKKIKQYINEVRKMTEIESTYDLDIERWNEIIELKNNICKDTKIEKSIITKLKEALVNNKLDKASKLLLELENSMEDIRNKYKIYERNII